MGGSRDLLFLFLVSLIAFTKSSEVSPEPEQTKPKYGERCEYECDVSNIGGIFPPKYKCIENICNCPSDPEGLTYDKKTKGCALIIGKSCDPDNPALGSCVENAECVNNLCTCKTVEELCQKEVKLAVAMGTNGKINIKATEIGAARSLISNSDSLGESNIDAKRQDPAPAPADPASVPADPAPVKTDTPALECHHCKYTPGAELVEILIERNHSCGNNISLAKVKCIAGVKYCSYIVKMDKSEIMDCGNVDYTGFLINGTAIDYNKSHMNVNVTDSTVPTTGTFYRNLFVCNTPLCNAILLKMEDTHEDEDQRYMIIVGAKYGYNIDAVPTSSTGRFKINFNIQNLFKKEGNPILQILCVIVSLHLFVSGGLCL